MTKIPQDRANAAEASLPTLVVDGSVFLRMRLTQAKGGSNSTADGVSVVAGGAGPGDAGFSAAAVVVAAMVVNSGGSRKDLFRRDAQSEKVPGTSCSRRY